VPSRKLTEEEFEEYLIRSNLNVGGWDMEMLANLFEPSHLLDYGMTEKMLLDTYSEPEKIDTEEKKTTKKKKECPNCGFQQ
jgi:hypothetical protein